MGNELVPWKRLSPYLYPIKVTKDAFGVGTLCSRAVVLRAARLQCRCALRCAFSRSCIAGTVPANSRLLMHTGTFEASEIFNFYGSYAKP